EAEEAQAAEKQQGPSQTERAVRADDDAHRPPGLLRGLHESPVARQSRPLEPPPIDDLRMVERSGGAFKRTAWLRPRAGRRRPSRGRGREYTQGAARRDAR